MQQHVLQNLVTATRLTLGADAVWLRMVSELHSYREPVELSDGEGALAPFIELSCEAHAEPDQRPRAELAGLDTPLNVLVSKDGRKCLMTLTISDFLLDAVLDQSPRDNRRDSRRDSKAAHYGTLMLGIRHRDPARLDRWLGSLNHQATDQRAGASLLDAIVTTCGQLAWEIYQTRLLSTDRVTHLLGASDFNLYLRQATEISARNEEGLVLLLVSPDDFALINREVGRSHADELLREFSKRIVDTVRREDRVFRYGGATVAVVARVAEEQAAITLANKVQASLQDMPKVNEQHRITFSIGAIASEPGDVADRDPRELSLCADQALNRARLLGGDQSVFFDGEFDRDDVSLTNPLGSIFTADTVKDYRNGRILWNTISLIAAESDPGRLADSFIELLEESFAGARAALLDIDEGVLGVLGTADGFAERALTGQRLRLVEQACKENRSQWRHAESSTADAFEQFATPLISRDLVFGCLFFECQFELDSSDQVFLKALADQLAGAIDRATLAARWAARKESESEKLKQELRDLRSGIPQNSLIAVSAAMQDLLVYAEKIAPSNASVLILGESGTGKEVLARTVHELSDRADRPMVTVDCGAIAHSLIDSELFGRAKGAYTGADAAQEGRITQADGATLFLDEIGELPLDVQAKLLRFVQEKEITPVGSTQGREIDTRIICATNRNLLQDVRDGRFREDLYYRLQVIQLAVPPLRQRREDVFPLVNHFLTRFAAQFGRPVPQLTPAAWNKVESYAWPGNVRELQNAIMRCVLSADGDRIDTGDLQFGEELPVHTASDTANGDRGPATTRLESIANGTAMVGPDDNHGDAWDGLRRALALRIEEAAAPDATIPPLGRWLIEDLVLSAAAITDSNTRRAAALLGMAETTFRRQLGKARRAIADAYRVRSDEWSTVTDVVQRLVQGSPGACGGDDGSLFDRCQNMLLEEVARCVGDDPSRGAGLMDISPPTYRRWLQKWGVAT